MTEKFAQWFETGCYIVSLVLFVVVVCMQVKLYNKQSKVLRMQDEILRRYTR